MGIESGAQWSAGVAADHFGVQRLVKQRLAIAARREVARDSNATTGHQSIHCHRVIVAHRMTETLERQDGRHNAEQVVISLNGDFVLLHKSNRKLHFSFCTLKNSFVCGGKLTRCLGSSSSSSNIALNCGSSSRVPDMARRISGPRS